MANQQRAYEGLRELALFAGAGGGILGGHLLGWRTVAAVEWEPYPASVLAARQNDGILPPFPIWDDVRTFDGRPWRGLVDVVSGGFPCQDISAAGKGAGIDGERSGMWAHMARIIGEVRPQYAFVENSPMLTSRGLGRVLGDLAALGYDAEWCCLSADQCGAPHERDRIWLLACDSDSNGKPTSAFNDEAQGMQGVPCPNANKTQLERGCVPGRIHQENPNPCYARWGKDKPGVDRVANGLAYQVDRLKAIGNGQVPRVAASAFTMLCNRAGWQTNPPAQRELF